MGCWARQCLSDAVPNAVCSSVLAPVAKECKNRHKNRREHGRAGVEKPDQLLRISAEAHVQRGASWGQRHSCCVLGIGFGRLPGWLWGERVDRVWD